MQRIKACTMMMPWVRRIILSGAERSAMTPAKGESKTPGSKSAAATMPSHVGEWVNSQVSQPIPVRWPQRLITAGNRVVLNSLWSR